MREYETVFVCNPNLADSQHKQIVEKITGMVEKHEGRVFFARNMGKKNLSYPIAKQKKGIYTCLDYASNGSAVNEIERNMRLDENVIRFLTVVKNEDVDVEARAAEILARGEGLETQPPVEGTPAVPVSVDEDSDEISDLGAVSVAENSKEE